jgi:hypothetical protein
MVLPVNVLTKIWIPQRRRRTRWSVDSFGCYNPRGFGHLPVTPPAKIRRCWSGGILLHVRSASTTNLLETILSNLPFFVFKLDLGFYIIDGVRRLDFESDRLAGEPERLNEDLHD